MKELWNRYRGLACLIALVALLPAAAYMLSWHRTVRTMARCRSVELRINELDAGQAGPVNGNSALIATKEMIASGTLLEGMEKGCVMSSFTPAAIRDEGISVHFAELEFYGGFGDAVRTIWNMEAMDEFQKINTDFLYAAGINSLVSRSYEGPHFDPHLGKGGRGHQTGGMRDCRYCKERATNGFVDYEEKRNDPEFWKRHRGCRCLIVTKLAHEREFQTAWSKNTGKNIRELYMQEQKKVM